MGFYVVRRVGRLIEIGFLFIDNFVRRKSYRKNDETKPINKSSTGMLDLLTVGPKFTRPACRTAAAAIDRYLLQARARPQQQTRRPPTLLLIAGQTDGQTDTRPFYDAYRMLRGPRNE